MACTSKEARTRNTHKDPRTRTRASNTKNLHKDAHKDLKAEHFHFNPQLGFGHYPGAGFGRLPPATAPLRRPATPPRGPAWRACILWRLGTTTASPFQIWTTRPAQSPNWVKLRSRVFRGSCSGASPSSAARPSDDWTPSPPPRSPSSRRTGASRVDCTVGQQDKVSLLEANFQERKKETEDREIELALARSSRDEMKRLIDETFSTPRTEDDTESLGSLGSFVEVVDSGAES